MARQHRKQLLKLDTQAEVASGNQVSIEMQIHSQPSVCENLSASKACSTDFIGDLEPLSEMKTHFKRKEMGKSYPQSTLGRTQSCITLVPRVCLCFFSSARLPIKQGSARSDDIIVAGAPQRFWSCVPNGLMPSCCSLRREVKMYWWFVILSILVDLLHKLTSLRESCLPWTWSKNAVWLLDSLSTLHLGTQSSFCQHDIQSAVEIKDLRTAAKMFPFGRKRFNETMKYYDRGKEGLNSLFRNKEEWLKRFCCYRETDTVQTSLKVKNSSTVGK